jgi:hypothetical protein
VQLVALVDSGADASLLDIGYADLLGLDRGEAKQVQAVVASGDEIAVFQWPPGLLELQFENRRFPFEGSFVEFAANTDGENLMGRKDFFAQYIVQFWDRKGLMNIDLSPDHPQGDAVSQISGRSPRPRSRARSTAPRSKGNRASQ